MLAEVVVGRKAIVVGEACKNSVDENKPWEKERNREQASKDSSGEAKEEKVEELPRSPP